MTTGSMDPYAAPQSDVDDIRQDHFSEIKIFSFSGRLGRVRYIAYSMALMILVWIGSGVLAALAIPVAGAGNSDLAGGITGLIMIVAYAFLVVASFTLAVRRINDFDSSGWLSLLLFVPLVNFFFTLALWFVPGTQGRNRYGPQTPPNGTGVTILGFLAPAVMIIGILAAIAIPAYQQYVHKAEQAQMQMR